jgi:glycosyltransferase involved in cell wall biosynthesis
VGGAEKVMIRLANQLSQQGEEVEIAVLDDAGELRREVSSSVRVTCLGVRQTRWAALRLVSFIRARRPLAVLSTLTRLSLLLLLVRPLLPNGTRIIVRQPSIATIDLDFLKPRWLYRLLYPRLIPTADAVICQSRAMADDLATMLQDHRTPVFTIPNPAPSIDLQKLHLVESPYAAGLNLVSAGRLSYEKGYDLLLAAFSQLLVQKPDARLTIIGDGPLADELRRMATQLGVAGRVQFVGYVADPSPWMAHARVLILPSRWEGFPNVLIEALACGTVVVATPCAGVSAEIVEQGVNGFVTSDESPSAIVAATLSALELAGRTLPQQVHASACRFDVRNIALQYVQAMTGT